MDHSSYVYKNKAFIQYFASVKHSKQIDILLENCTNSELRALCEVVLNYLSGNLTSKEDFSRRISLLNTLADRSVSLPQKRAVLTSKIYRTILHKLLSTVNLEL